MVALGGAACVSPLPGSEVGAGAGSGGASTGGAGGAAGQAVGSGGEAGRLTGGGGVGPGGAAAAAMGGFGGTTTGGSGGNGPVRLVIFYTRWGTSYPEWLPSGSERNFTLGPILAPLAPFQNQLIVVNGLTNANIYVGAAGNELRGADANDPGDAMFTLLTGGRAPVGGPAGGPSLDTVVGNRPSTLGYALRLAIGQFGFNDDPGVSFASNGYGIRGEQNPDTVSMRLFGRPATGDVTTYPGLAATLIGVSVEALAAGKTDTVVLMWGDGVMPTWLGLNQDVYTLSHLTSGAYTALSTPMPPSNPTGDFQKLQTWYAQQFALLVGQMSQVPIGAGSLLDQSVVVWVSESGTGSDHQGYFMPVVIAGRAGGQLDTGRFIDFKPRPVAANDLQVVTRTQGDLLAALATLWGLAPFGDPAIARQPLVEIFK